MKEWGEYNPQSGLALSNSSVGLRGKKTSWVG